MALVDREELTRVPKSTDKLQQVISKGNASDSVRLKQGVEAALDHLEQTQMVRKRLHPDASSTRLGSRSRLPVQRSAGSGAQGRPVVGFR